VHLWADRFDGSLEDVFDLQDRVASNVAGVIEPTLRKAEFERIGRKPTESLDAYDLCLRALALRDRRSAESVYEAIGLLKQALVIDPGYTSAKALVGWFRANETAHGRRPVSAADAAEAVALAKEAMDTGKDAPMRCRWPHSLLVFSAASTTWQPPPSTVQLSSIRIPPTPGWCTAW